MEEKRLSERPLTTAADYEAAIDDCLAQMQRLQEQMRSDQVEIDRLKAETRTILARLKTT